MMLWVDTPGVYFQWTDDRNHLAGEVRSDIAGFVGIAARGPLHRALKVESWSQFTSTFGGFTPQGYLAHAVAGFFANGGSACWVVRAADPDRARAASLDLNDGNGRVALRLEASSPGIWGNQITLRLLPEGQGRFALDLRLSGGEHELWNDLTTAVSSLELLDHRRRPTLRLVSYRPELWGYALAVQVTVQGEHFSLDIEPQSLKFEEACTDTTEPQLELEALSFMECMSSLCPKAEHFADLSLDPEDERYAPRALGAGAEGSQLVVAYDLFSTSTTPQNLPAPLLPNPRAGVGVLRSDERHVGRLLNRPENGSRLVQVRSDLTVKNTYNGPLPEWLYEAYTPQLQGTARLTGGRDGLAPDANGDGGLVMAHLSGAGAPLDKDWGLTNLEGIHEIGLVAVPDIQPKEEIEDTRTNPEPRCSCGESPLSPPLDSPPYEFAPPFDDLEVAELQDALVVHCEVLKDRFALLDPPPWLTTAQDLVRWRGRFDTSFAALYFPWLGVPDALGLFGLLRRVPPSGHIAGLVAATDLRVGVHKPPANERLRGVRELAVNLHEIDHGVLNRAQVNLIRPVTGRGLRLLGARTLSSDSEVRYVNVRRMLTLIVDALDKNLAWSVMEPNDERLWVAVERLVHAYLDGLWRRGQLAGEDRQQAFFVRCDRTTNPPEEVDLGWLSCQIGVYLPWPAEFIIAHVGRRQGPLEVLEVRRDNTGRSHG